MRIKKVINNNLLCVVDDSGHEMIVSGKGIGYKRKFGERVDPSTVEKTYRMENREAQGRLRELVEQIPIQYLDLTQSLVDYYRQQVSQPLNESLVITLADHISFAIQRKEQGIEFRNPLADSIMLYYPTEYHLGQYGLQMIERTQKVKLHPDEASFIALHIVNAELNTNMSEMNDMTRLLDGCIRVTEFYYNVKFDRNSLDFSRFVVHLRYLVQRLYQKKCLEDTTNQQDILFRQLIQRNCREHYECSCRIAAYIESRYGTKISEEEKIYLTIHLKRLNTVDDS